MTLPKLTAKVSYDLSLNNNIIWAFIECYYHSTLQKFHLFLSISFQFKLIMAVKFLRRNCDINILLHFIVNRTLLVLDIMKSRDSNPPPVGYKVHQFTPLMLENDVDNNISFPYNFWVSFKRLHVQQFTTNIP